MSGTDPRFTLFRLDISAIELPKSFTFPFFYQPHPLTQIAARELQDRISQDADLQHNFMDAAKGECYGKMMGVLIVRGKDGQLGYLSAFSGKLMEDERPTYFVPPVLELHAEHTFYKEGERALNAMTEEIESLKNAPELLALRKKTREFEEFVEEELTRGRRELREMKKDRARRREEAQGVMEVTNFTLFNQQLAQESIAGQLKFKHYSIRLKTELEKLQEALSIEEQRIKDLEAHRRAKSNALQKVIFDQYAFLSAAGKVQRLTEIFPNFEEQQPPSGSGDCCAPKLLQYAYLQGYEPICMGEFWWGKAPGKEVRKSGTFYPSCNSRCRPILGHMLQGLDVEENPLLTWSKDLPLPILFEDDAVVAVNKPDGMLSVPGKEIQDSAFTRIQQLYPDATGAVLLHRLDMSTSGILLFAKTAKAHKFIQRQFITRTLKKRYIAVVDGDVEGDTGWIHLPLRPDYYDLPRQMVCEEHGKEASTRWEVLERKNGQTRLALYPVTGRTHQLRIHCAHSRGLGIPIVGDELYGLQKDRLLLHAEQITFIHPLTKEWMTLQTDPMF